MKQCVPDSSGENVSTDVTLIPLLDVHQLSAVVASNSWMLVLVKQDRGLCQGEFGDHDWK